jgi:hypothetical protein
MLNKLKEMRGLISTFVFICYLRVRFLLELNVDYLSYLKEKFQEFINYPFLFTKVVDYPPLVGVILHNVQMFTSMEEVSTNLRNLE